MNLSEIKELIKILNDTDISELNLESDGVKIAIRKGNSGGQLGALPVNVPVAVMATQAAVPAVPVLPKTVPNERVTGELVTAPMVGTFYRAPAPDAPAFVEVGQHIRAGQPVCIIEAMKLMNEIEAETEGKVVEILVENGEPVEFGQPLFRVEK